MTDNVHVSLERCQFCGRPFLLYRRDQPAGEQAASTVTCPWCAGEVEETFGYTCATERAKEGEAPMAGTLGMPTVMLQTKDFEAVVHWLEEADADALGAVYDVARSHGRLGPEKTASDAKEAFSAHGIALTEAEAERVAWAVSEHVSAIQRRQWRRQREKAAINWCSKHEEVARELVDEAGESPVTRKACKARLAEIEGERRLPFSSRDLAHVLSEHGAEWYKPSTASLAEEEEGDQSDA